MKFAVIKERKSPPDRRVVFTPDELARLKAQHPEAVVQVESSDIRIFSDQAYRDAGIEVVPDVSGCDVFFGVKEVPVEALVPGKKYFFFSHTIKKQPYNQKLLQAILDKRIDLYDHETIVDEKGKRLIGFGRYAGIVGAYNGIRAFGLKYELFELPKAEALNGKDELIARLRRIALPPIKIVLTGNGKVAHGVMEILDAIRVKKVSPQDFLAKNFSDAVYTQLDVLDYNKRKDGRVLGNENFYRNPQDYVSDFDRFTKAADIYMSGHFYGNGAPVILSRDALRAPDNKVKVVADISCDVAGPIACTLRSSTIADPLYGYLPSEDKEVDFRHPAAIVVMAVDNLPCELPKDASEGFGEMFMEHVVPAFFNGDRDGILARAQMTRDGHLTPRFRYLEGYVHESAGAPR